MYSSYWFINAYNNFLDMSKSQRRVISTHIFCIFRQIAITSNKKMPRNFRAFFSTQ